MKFPNRRCNSNRFEEIQVGSELGNDKRIQQLEDELKFKYRRFVHRVKMLVNNNIFISSTDLSLRVLVTSIVSDESCFLFQGNNEDSSKYKEKKSTT